MKQILAYEEAKKVIQKLDVQTQAEYKQLARQGKLPKGLPSCPEWYYGRGFGKNRWHRFLPYEDAKKLMLTYKLKSKREWDDFRRSNKIPKNIPKDPRCVYKKQFKGYGDWLGNKNVKYTKGYSIEGIKFWSYKRCRSYIRKFNFYSSNEFHKAFREGKIVKNIPQYPPDVFKKTGEWESWPKFLGHNNLAGAMANYNFMSFEDAKKWTKKSGIKTMREFKKLHGQGKIPKAIPCHADDYYSKTGKWRGWNNFIGSTKNIHMSKYHKWRPFEEAKEYVRNLNFQTIKQYKQWCKSGKKPIDIPVDPQRVYGRKLV